MLIDSEWFDVYPLFEWYILYVYMLLFLFLGPSIHTIVYIQFDWILKALICFTSYFNIIQFHLFLHIYLRKSMYFSVYCFHRMLTALCSSVQFHSNSIHTYSHFIFVLLFYIGTSHSDSELRLKNELHAIKRWNEKEKNPTNRRQTEKEIDWNCIEKEANKILNELNEAKHTIK